MKVIDMQKVNTAAPAYLAKSNSSHIPTIITNNPELVKGVRATLGGRHFYIPGSSFV